MDRRREICPHCNKQSYIITKMFLVLPDQYRKDLFCLRCSHSWSSTASLVSVKNAYRIIWIAKQKTSIAFHRWVWEAAHNEKLRSKDTIHHINGHKGDNRPENLIKMSCHDHAKIYIKERRKDARIKTEKADLQKM